MTNYVKMSRSFMQTSFYKDKAARHVAEHLIMLCRFKDGPINVHGGVMIDLKRGQCATSRAELVKGTGCTPDVVRRVLADLEACGFITKVDYKHKATIITVVKYNEYQGLTNVNAPTEIVKNPQLYYKERRRRREERM